MTETKEYFNRTSICKPDQAEERIFEWEDSSFEIIQSEVQNEKRTRKWKTLCELWDIIKWSSLLIIGILEGEDKEKGAECKFKDMMVEKFPDIGRELNIQIDEAGHLKISAENYLLQDTL